MVAPLNCNMVCDHDVRAHIYLDNTNMRLTTGIKVMISISEFIDKL